MNRSANSAATAFAVIVWVTVLLLIGFTSLKNMSDASKDMNIKIKSMEDIINGDN